MIQACILWFIFHSSDRSRLGEHEMRGKFDLFRSKFKVWAEGAGDEE